MTGRKFEIECLFSVFLSRGLTEATLALSAKIFCLKLLFIPIESGVLKGSAAILIKADGILSSPIAFLGFSCWSMFQTSSLLTGENIMLLLMFPLVLILLFIFNMLGWFLYEFLYELCYDIINYLISIISIFETFCCENFVNTALAHKVRLPSNNTLFDEDVITSCRSNLKLHVSLCH